MKIIITGGHFSPALSVIEKLKGEEVVVVGRKYSFENDPNESYEYRICKKLGIKFIELKAGRLSRKFSVATITSLLKIPNSLITARHILNQEKPDVIMTFGGYVALPIALAASIFGIPVILHEGTQKAGLAAKVISKVAAVVLLSFESSKKYFKNKKTVLTGLPLRSEIFNEQKNSIKGSFIYITGGSTGAHAINKAMLPILPDLLEDNIVVHQVGDSRKFGDLEKFLEFKKNLPKEINDNYIVEPFFEPEMAMALLQHATLVVGRSGINTVLELIVSKTPALLIPLPYGQLNEQKDNAVLFKRLGLGEYIDQDSLTSQGLISVIHAMIKERKKYETNFSASQSYIHPDAAGKIADQILFYGGQRENTPKYKKA